MVNNNQTIDELNWNEALNDGKYLNFEDGSTTDIVIVNAKLGKKLDPQDINLPAKTAIQADVIEQDGKKVEKVIDSTSIKLLLALKPILANKDGTMRKGEVKLRVMRVGEKKQTQFSVKELPHGGNTPATSTIPTITQATKDLQKAKLDQHLLDGNITQEGYDLAIKQLNATPVQG